MSDWILVACLKQLFTEFNVIAPNRAHDSDGSIGDTAHQHEVSDHNPDETGSVPIHDADHVNEVHAIDVDVDLREPGLSMEDVVQFLLGRCRSGAETRLRYMIYNRRIWEADNGWRQRAYTGASAHTEHAHFSASYDSGKEASAASWHLGDIPVTVTPADMDKIADKVVEKLLAAELEDPYDTATPKRTVSVGGWLRYSPSRNLVDSRLKQAAGVAKDVQDIEAGQEALNGFLDQMKAEILAAIKPTS